MVAADPDRDARLFEPVAAAIDAVAPGVEVLRPGLLVLAARGVSRYFGPRNAAAERLIDEVVGGGGGVPGRDRRRVVHRGDRRAQAALVPPGERVPSSLLRYRCRSWPPSRAWRQPHAVSWSICCTGSGCGPSATSRRCPRSMWRRGSGPMRCWRTAARAGEPERPPSARRCRRTWRWSSVRPADRPGRCGGVRGAGAGRAAARQAVRRRGGVHPAAGAREHRQRGASFADLAVRGTADPGGTADRVRWQLDGWLTGRSETGRRRIAVLRLEPVEVVAAGALQLGLWGGVGDRGRAGPPGAGARAGPARGRRRAGGGAQRRAGPGERDHAAAVGGRADARRGPLGALAGRLPEPSPSAVLTGRPGWRWMADGGDGCDGHRTGCVQRAARAAAVGEPGVGGAGLGRTVAGGRAVVGPAGRPDGGPGPGAAGRVEGAAGDLHGGRWSVEGIYE